MKSYHELYEKLITLFTLPVTPHHHTRNEVCSQLEFSNLISWCRSTNSAEVFTNAKLCLGKKHTVYPPEKQHPFPIKNCYPFKLVL